MAKGTTIVLARLSAAAFYRLPRSENASGHLSARVRSPTLKINGPSVAILSITCHEFDIRCRDLTVAFLTSSDSSKAFPVPCSDLRFLPSDSDLLRIKSGPRQRRSLSLVIAR